MTNLIIPAIVIILLLILLIKIITTPLKLIVKILIHAALGYVALFIFNFIGAWFGITIPITLLSAVVAGVFGVPGVAVLLILQFIL